VSDWCQTGVRLVKALAAAAHIAAPVLLILHSAAAQTATVAVTSYPSGAEVYVDGRLAGVTPLALNRPAPGRHLIRLALSGYLDNARTLEFTAQQPTSLHVTLTPDSSGAPGGSWFARRKWVWIGAAGGGAGAALFLTQRQGAAPTAGTVIASPAVGLQSGTAIAFASQGASVESGQPLEYSWEFGDGITASGALVTHVYETSGTFTARLTVTAGKKSATVVSSPVTIRSVTGAWRGTLAAVNTMLTLAQSGASITGSYQESGVTGTVVGTVRATAPRINLTISTPAYSATYAADPDTAVDVLTGTYREQGLTLGWVLSRQ
jgi:PKD domain-containing protein/PEGA domain-containing protein